MHNNCHMDLWTAPVLDVRSLLSREREDLLGFVGSLTDDEWFSPTQVPGWTVKDLALHILDDDLGWLSRGRDHDRSGRLDVDDSGVVDALGCLRRPTARLRIRVEGRRELGRRPGVAACAAAGLPSSCRIPDRP